MFGPKNSLTYFLEKFIDMIIENKYTFKAKAAIDNELIAKILYSIDIRVQLWLDLLESAVDRERVNDKVLDFTSVGSAILLDGLSTILPSIFIPKTTGKLDQAEENPGTKRQKRGGREGKRADDKDERANLDGRKQSNPDMMPEFKLLAMEDYKTVFANRCIDQRVAWSETCRMCPRWHTLGLCFDDCRNKASHVKPADIPANKKKAYLIYLAAVRQNN